MATSEWIRFCEQQLKENQQQIESIAAAKVKEDEIISSRLCDYNFKYSEILLCGYFRQFRTQNELSSDKSIMNISDYLPPLVITLCIAYRSASSGEKILNDRWNTKGDDVELDLNGQLATFTNYAMSHTKFWQTVYGKKCINRKGIHKWNIQILTHGSGLFVGVAHVQHDGYGQICQSGLKFAMDKVSSYGFGVEDGVAKQIILENEYIVEDFTWENSHGGSDIVMTILLDMDDQKVSFFKNGEFILTAPRIKTSYTNRYRLAVSAFGGGKVNLLSYQQIM
eukprot:134812_1